MFVKVLAPPWVAHEGNDVRELCRGHVG